MSEQPECKSISNRICSLTQRVGDSPISATSYTIQTISFSDSQTNYFNHSSIDEAVYELSRYLPLLSFLLWERFDRVFVACVNDLRLLLCHLHLPQCPMRTPTITQDQCHQMMNTSSNCHTAIIRLQRQNASFQWPPVQVNCSDSKWFSNSSRTQPSK